MIVIGFGQGFFLIPTVYYATRDVAPEQGTTAAALFNLSDAPRSIDYTVEELGLAEDRGRERAGVYDVWAGTSLGRIRRVKLTLPPHGTVLLERRPPARAGFE